MANPQGTFNETQVSAGWFDSAGQAAGWFDGDFLDAVSPSVPPFRSVDFVSANPIRRKIGGFVEIGQTLLLATLAAVAATTVFRDPFVTTVARPKAAQHEVGTNSVLFRTAAVQDPFRQNDWNVPSRVRHYAVDQQSVNAKLLSVKPHNQNDWYAGTKRTVQQPDSFRNYLTSAPTQLAPFSQTDWDNPVSQRKALRVGYHRPSFDPGAPVVTGAAPFYQNDWQNPTWPKNRFGSQTLDLATYAFAAPFAQYEWYVGAKRRSADSGFAHSLALVLTAQPAVRPFAQYVWQNPQASKNVLTGQSIKTSALVVQAVERPFNQYDWQNPGFRHTLAGQGLSTALIASSTSAPFAQLVWDNPKSARRTLSGQGFKTGLIIDSSAAPFFQTDWQNPVRRYVAQDVQQNRSYALLATPVAKPFFQSDWQNPVRQNKTVQHHQQSGASLVLTTAVLQPFSQNDWQNPVRVPGRITVTHHRPSFDPSAPVSPSPPFFQSDWQNPVWLKDRFGGQSLDLTVYSFDKPFVQNDWQNPVCRPKTAQDFLQSGASRVLTTVVLRPFSQNDWQNPKYFVPRDPRFSLEGTPLPNEIPPAVTPPADEPPRGDGGWRRKHRGPDYKKFEEKRRKDKEFEDELRALYAELIEEPKAAEIAAEIVEPITASEAEIPPPSQVRFEYATDEIETALLLLETRIAEFKAERAKEQQVAAEKLAAAQEAVRLQEVEDKQQREIEEKRIADEAEAVELDELMELYDLYEIIQNLD